MASVAGAFGLEQQQVAQPEQRRGAAAAEPRPAKIADAALRALQHRLIPVDIALDDALAGRLPVLPVLDRAAQGYAVAGLAVEKLDDLATASGGMIAVVRRHHVRSYAELAGGFDRYFAMLPPRTRSMLAVQAERIAALSGGAVAVARFHHAAAVEPFLDQVHRLARRGVQHRAPGALAADADVERGLVAAAQHNKLRCWVLSIAGEPAAYLHARIAGDTVRIEHYGQDPAFADLAPLAVLLLDAIRDLFGEERLRRVDLSAARSRLFDDLATGGVASVDVTLLRPSLANRIGGVVLRGYDRTRRMLAPLGGMVRLPNLRRRQPQD